MELLTKDDLRQLRLLLLSDIEKLLADRGIDEREKEEVNEWLRSKAIRRIMDISPGTLQNLRITGKVRFKKVMGSYYYSRSDVVKLFKEE